MLTGIILPRAFTCLQPYPFYLMMLLLFLSLLPIKTKTVWRTVRDSFKTIFTLTLFKLIILPAAVYVLFHIFCPPYAVASLLLTGISNSSLVLVMVVVSSILAPFTLPILVKLFLAKSVGISLFAMIRMLCLVIFVPFVAVQMIRRLSPGLNLLIMKRQFPLSLVAFALINLGVFPQYADLFRRNPATILDATLVACILSGIYVLSGMIFYQRRSLETRLAAAVSLGN